MGTKPSDDSAERQIVTTNKALSYTEIEKISKAFVASGMFGEDMDKISKGITKIMAGQELGLAPFASMRAVHVIEGNATLSANTMAGMVKSSGRYDYTVTKKDLNVCEIEFYEIRGGKRIKMGVETFDVEEAKMAGMFDPECSEAPVKHNLRTITMYKKGGGSWQKQNACNCKNNWKNYPKAMMFARCISNGVRTYCPDVFSGMLVYTPDELGARVAGDGNIIDIDPETGEVKSQSNPPKEADPAKSEGAVDVDQTPEDESKDGVDEPAPEEPAAEEEAEASGEAADVAEEEPEVEITDELKKELLDHIESFGMKPQFKIRFIKETTGSITPNMIKKDADWRKLYDRVMAVLDTEEVLPDEWLTKPGSKQSELVPDEEDAS